MEPNTEAFFVSERCGPLSRKIAWLMVDRYGELADFLKAGRELAPRPAGARTGSSTPTCQPS